MTKPKHDQSTTTMSWCQHYEQQGYQQGSLSWCLVVKEAQVQQYIGWWRRFIQAESYSVARNGYRCATLLHGRCWTTNPNKEWPSLLLQFIGLQYLDQFQWPTILLVAISNNILKSKVKLFVCSRFSFMELRICNLLAKMKACCYCNCFCSCRSFFSLFFPFFFLHTTGHTLTGCDLLFRPDYPLHATRSEADIERRF